VPYADHHLQFRWNIFVYAIILNPYSLSQIILKQYFLIHATTLKQSSRQSSPDRLNVDLNRH